MSNDIPKIALAGSVTSSLRTLQGLIRNGARMVGVLGLDEKASGNVSGFVSMENEARAAGIPFRAFEKINAQDVVETIRKWTPDIFFIVGLSQLAEKEILRIPRIGSVGFHPTRLPENRGRAPVPWLVLDSGKEGGPSEGAATFFLVDEGVDSGPVLAQESFEVTENDYSSDVVEKVMNAIDRVLDQWVPRLNAGEWTPAPQDPEKATFNAKRFPRDGLIDWKKRAAEILTLIRAAGRPYPGAYTYVSNRKLIVWQAEEEKKQRIRGVVGRILEVSEDGKLLVQTGGGLLRLLEYGFEESEAEPAPMSKRLKKGTRLGYASDDEIFILRRRIAEMEERLSRLESLPDNRP